MLVLSRKVGERLIIPITFEDNSSPEHIIMTLCEVRGGTQTARIGIDAPPAIAIIREELYEHRHLLARPPRNESRR